MPTPNPAPSTVEEFNAKYNDNQRITGFGLGNVRMHLPCPFCAEPDFASCLIEDVQEALSKPTVCSSCKRGVRTVFTRGPNSVSFVIVQTEGPDAPAFIPIRREPPVTVKLNGADVTFPIALVSFEDVVKAAGMSGAPSVTVHSSGPHVTGWRSFIFNPGATNELRAGDVVNAVHTGNA